MLVRRSLMHYMLFALCLTFTSMCGAITFGEVKVYSYLDEPLSAELELTSLEGIDPGQIVVTLAKPADFIRYGMQRPYFLTNLLFDIVTYQDRVLVYIRSTKVVKVPFLELLIDFSWPTGGFIKDYTLLINPPPRDLNAANRPQPLSVIAMKEAEVKSFGNDLQLQVDAQENASNVVKRKTILPGQTSFSDESVYEAEEQLNQEKTAPPPAVASGASATTTPAGAGTSSATQTNTAVPTATPAPTATPVPVQTSTTPGTMPPTVPAQANPANIALPTPTSPPTATNPTPPPVTPVPNTSPSVKPTNATQPTTPKTSANGNATERRSLNYAIEKLQEADAIIESSTDLTHLTAARKKHLEMYKDVSPVDPDAEIDFGDVIKNKTAKPPEGMPGAISPPGAPPGLPGADLMKPPAAPPPSGQLGFALVLVGFALGIVGVVGFGLKKGWHHKLLAKHIKNADQDLELHPEERVDSDLEVDLDSELAKFDGMQQHEEIELTTAKLPEPDMELDLDAIEKEIAKLGLDPVKKAHSSSVAKGSGKTVSDLLNLGAAKIEPVAPLSNESIDTDTVDDISLKNANKEDSLDTTNVDLHEGIKDTSELHSDAEILDAAFKFDEIEIDLGPEPESSLNTNDQISGMGIVPNADEMSLSTESDDLPFTSSAPAETATEDVPLASGIVNLSAQNELKLEETPAPSTGGLRLEPEGATMLKNEPDQITLKLQLAKKYLEAGDKESAREILEEVIAIATDAQKVEAEIMLSGIL